MAFTGSDIFKIICAIFIPPVGVFFERGCGADLLINILLTILGYIPGIIHALYVSPTLLVKSYNILTIYQVHHPQVLDAKPLTINKIRISTIPVSSSVITAGVLLFFSCADEGGKTHEYPWGRLGLGICMV
jgi:uncharacterized membrane protein YqaE (UPF0057 family)